MKGIINAFSTLINIIKMLFNIIMSIFSTLGMVLKYLVTIGDLALDSILTLPTWLQSFALITICISLAYFLIGRNPGKSD